MLMTCAVVAASCAAIMHIFFFQFYRTLFSSLGSPSVFAVIMLGHVCQELCMYPLRMTQLGHDRWAEFMRWAASCLPESVQQGPVGTWMRQQAPLEVQQRELCLLYVSR